MINVNVILSSLATLVVALRVFTRSRILRSVGVDDWLIMLGMLLAWILAVWSSIGAAWGLGRHIWDVPKESREGAGKVRASQGLSKLVYTSPAIANKQTNILSQKKNSRKIDHMGYPCALLPRPRRYQALHSLLPATNHPHGL